MTSLGLPVSAGFTISTAACMDYLAYDQQFPAGLWEQVLSRLHQLEAQTGQWLGDATDPLLLSSRSGAKFSMPGMMDSVLNIGLNDEIVAGLIAATHNPRFIYDLYRRLIQMFGTVVLGIADEPFEEAITAARTRFAVATDAELPAEACSG